MSPGVANLPFLLTFAGLAFFEFMLIVGISAFRILAKARSTRAGSHFDGV
jgi:hypothetical protein